MPQERSRPSTGNIMILLKKFLMDILKVPASLKNSLIAKSKKINVSLIILFSLFVYTCHLDNAGLSLAPNGLVQSNLFWRSPLQCFIHEFNMTSPIQAPNLEGKTSSCIQYSHLFLFLYGSFKIPSIAQTIRLNGE